jgi:glycosyltransferase involved in cell wall biosynthesis
VITNVWNEELNIKGIVEMMNQQTLKPDMWLWIDDGSMNGTYNAIIRAKTDIQIQIFSMPQKESGNLDTIGKAFSLALPPMYDSFEFDYMTLADVDNRYPPDYYEKMCRYMDGHPEVGALSAQVRGEAKRNPDNPMGGGKIIRWGIVRKIKKYWDLAPDAFLNIKARAMGFETVALQNYYIDSAPTDLLSEKGRFRYGRRMYYVSRHPFLVLYQALMFLLKRDAASEYLRGYFQEWGRGVWKCDDLDVKHNFSLEYRMRTFTIARFLSALRRLIR